MALISPATSNQHRHHSLKRRNQNLIPVCSPEPNELDQALLGLRRVLINLVAAMSGDHRHCINNDIWQYHDLSQMSPSQIEALSLSILSLSLSITRNNCMLQSDGSRLLRRPTRKGRKEACYFVARVLSSLSHDRRRKAYDIICPSGFQIVFKSKNRPAFSWFT